MTEQNKALIRYLIEEAFNNGNLEAAEGHFTDDYVPRIPSAPRESPLRGHAAFLAVVDLWRAASSDWHMTIEDLVAEGDLVANRFTTRGTHDGSLFGIPATGRRFTVHGQELHRVRDGKVAETWVCDDVPGILLQLGIILPPFGKGSRPEAPGSGNRPR